ncbi:conserved hypothetical protein [Vibrio chagasii]|nr:conserved hypothetical protein [Vibrio chagasii]
MTKNHVAIVSLNAYESIEEILEETPEQFNGKPNGLAIVFDSGAKQPLALQRDLLLMANNEFKSSVSELAPVHELSDNGDIDPDLKHLLIQHACFTENLLNCYSVRQNGSGLKELEGFDRMELKEKLLRMASIL